MTTSNLISQSQSSGQSDRAQNHSRRLVLITFFIGMIATSYAGWNAWHLQLNRTVPLDLDGWGELVQRQAAQGRNLAILFNSPSLWKGPIVPFVFGVVYYVVPFEEAILAFNAMSFGLAASLFFVGFCKLGCHRAIATCAVLAWVFYPPFREIFGYYYAEPFVSMVIAINFLVVAEAVTRSKSPLFFLAGAMAGVLLLARATLLFATCGMLVFAICHARGKRSTVAVCYIAGFLLTFSPWGIRNAIVYREFIPFTLEGGKILFQGTYLPGDDVAMGFAEGVNSDKGNAGTLRALPEFLELEKAERGKSEIEQYHYWHQLAIRQALNDVPGQVRLCLRKAIRFWCYLPYQAWVPSWKTGLMAIICVPLALYSATKYRRLMVVQLCAIFVGGLWAFHAVVHSEFRYSFPIWPMAFLLVAFAICDLVPRRVFGRSKKTPATNGR